ncbi:uncharacterized mitochondrial protein AtMg00810-like [Lycium ferocissimum]|uniref:uncharacterized mitochondrial protein AtMg00810-like n=1 Tax=Lycium ferocissimum TaxID=112874 RepID=UPI002815DBEB|nr:uncharacterized mitochondrial protein AtMg00810-like [Lycium ferocissimum]
MTKLMDVKSAFSKWILDEEFFVKQPPGFENPTHPYHLFKLSKALYGLKQIYADDIIFGSSNPSLCKKFSDLMQREYEMSMMGELTFFLGLQVYQTDKGIFISQNKYTKELIHKFEMDNVKLMGTPMSPTCSIDKDDEASPKESYLSAVQRIIRYLLGTITHGLWYPKTDSFKLEGFSDADFAGDKDDRKSTSGTCQLLGNSLISWNSKKQGSVSLSTTKDEYTAIEKWYVCINDVWVLKKDKDPKVLCPPVPDQFKPSTSSNPPSVDYSSEFQLEHVRDITKEAGADVARLRLKIDQGLKEKLATNLQASDNALPTKMTDTLDSMKGAMVNTLAHFLHPFSQQQQEQEQA